MVRSEHGSLELLATGSHCGLGANPSKYSSSLSFVYSSSNSGISFLI